MRICQNDNCPHELKPNQKRFCSRKCYQEARLGQKVDDALFHVKEFESEKFNGGPHD